MAIYANGPDFQTYSVGTAPTPIFYTRGYGGTAISSGVVVHNPTVANVGTVAIYVSVGGTISSAGGTASAAFLLGAGVELLPGQQMVIQGTAVTGTTATFGPGTFDMAGCTSANVTITVESGYASQTLVS